LTCARTSANGRGSAHDLVDRGIRRHARARLVDLAGRERDAHAAKLALGVLADPLVAGRRQERRVRIEIVKHAARGVVEQLALIGGVDVVGLDRGKRLGERVERLEPRNVGPRHSVGKDRRRDCGSGEERSGVRCARHAASLTQGGGPVRSPGG
jgi:hypothetical protein